MKRLLFSLVLCALFVASASATPLGPACASNYLSSYQGLYPGGCMVGDLLFTDFVATASGNSTPIDGSQITVSPFTDNGNSGLQFNAPWGVAGGPGDYFTQDTAISFHVLVAPGYLLSALDLTIKAPVTDGKGEVRVVEQTDPTGTPASIGVVQNQFSSVWKSTMTFDPAVGSADVWKDVSVVTSYGGAATGGSGNFSIMQQTFHLTETPEPGTMAMLGAGLLVVVTAARRRFHR